MRTRRWYILALATHLQHNAVVGVGGIVIVDWRLGFNGLDEGHEEIHCEGRL